LPAQICPKLIQLNVLSTVNVTEQIPVGKLQMSEKNNLLIVTSNFAM